MMDRAKYLTNQFVSDLPLGPEVRIANFLYATLLASIVSITLIGLIPGAGFNLVLTAAWIAAVFVAISCVSYMLSGYFRSAPLGLLLTIAMICLVGIDRTNISALLFGILCAVSLVYALMRLRISRGEILPWLASVIAISAYSLGVDQYTSFDMLALAHSGMIYNDTIFHASVSAMIKNYGAISTGLHGPVEMSYHILSHVIVAGIGRISGVSLLEIYGFIFQIFLIPLFIFSISYVSTQIDRNKKYNILYLVIITIIMLLSANYIFARWAFWDSYELSESYIVSLIILVIGVPTLLQRDIGAKAILISVLVAYGTAQAKGSVGLVYIAAWSARLVLAGGWSRKRDLIAFGLVVLAFLLAAGRAAQEQSTADIVAFDFIRNFSLYGASVSEVMQVWAQGGQPSLVLLLLAAVAMGSFVVFHFFFVWVVVLHACWKDGLVAAVRSPLVACCLGAMAFGVLIASVFSLPGGAVYYFSSAASFIALPAVVAIVYDGLRWVNQRIFDFSATTKFIFVVPCLGIIVMSGTKGYEKIINRPSSAGMAENEFVSGLRKLRTEAPLDRVFRADPAVLQANPQKLCWTRPLSFPAISERAWTGVIPPDPDCAYQYYGFAYYGVGAEDQSVKVPLDLGDALRLEDWPGPDLSE